MNTPRPTPETDAVVANNTGDNGFLDEIVKTCRRLERERDERREYAERCKEGCIKLSFAIDRIDYACGNPNEMEVSDYALHQNEDHVVQRVKEKLEAMREAIKEAHTELSTILGTINNSRGVAGWHLNGDIATWDEFEINPAATITKLKPFIKP